MRKLWNKIGWIVMTVMGSFVFGASYAIFMAPNDLNAGGISGLAAIIVQLINPNGTIPFLSVGVLSMLINLPLFAIGGVKIGKKFFFGSLLGLALSSVVMDTWPAALALKLDPLLAALYGGVVAGVGLGFVYLAGTSTGGSDIVVRLVKLKAKNMNIGQIAIIFDVFVVTLTGIVFHKVENALYTGITVFLCGKLIDMVVYGFDNTKTAMIITQKYDEMAQILGEKLGRGATFLYSQGTYSKQDSKVVLVAVYPKQVAELKDIVTTVDPRAFVILQEAHQVLGDGFATHSKDSL